MTYTFNKRQRIIRRAKRHIERVLDLYLDLRAYGTTSEYLDVLFYLSEMFPVDVKSPKGDGL